MIALIRSLRQERRRYFLLAGGSNVVGPDGFWRGVLVHYFSPHGRVTIKKQRIEVGAGVPLARLIRLAIQAGLAGMENLAGIPGTVGGAIFGNAGAYGQTITDCLVAVEVFDGRSRRWLKKEQCRFVYRQSIFQRRPWVILQAVFVLAPGDTGLLIKKAREIVRLRRKKYKPNLLCPGSFFKNVLVKDVPRRALLLIPPDKIINGKIPAGFLLEQIGACGLRTRHLSVASYHGNLIINRGGATCREVKRLAALLKRRVFKQFGIGLEEEVRFVS